MMADDGQMIHICPMDRQPATQHFVPSTLHSPEMVGPPRYMEGMPQATLQFEYHRELGMAGDFQQVGNPDTDENIDYSEEDEPCDGYEADIDDDMARLRTYMELHFGATPLDEDLPALYETLHREHTWALAARNSNPEIYIEGARDAGKMRTKCSDEASRVLEEEAALIRVSGRVRFGFGSGVGVGVGVG